MNAKSVNPEYVLIEPLAIQEEGLLKRTEEDMLKEQRKQNRGNVIMKGKNCHPWIDDGDLVSFYRNAATPITIEEKEYVLLHQDHVMANFGKS